MELYVPGTPPSVLLSQIRALLPGEVQTIPDASLPPFVVVIATPISIVVVTTSEVMGAMGDELTLAAAQMDMARGHAGETYVVALPLSAGWLQSHLKEAFVNTQARPEHPAPLLEQARTSVPGLPEGEHPLAGLIPAIDPLRRADCCGAAPLVAVLLPSGDDPLLFCGHHARKSWAALAEPMVTYRVLS